ncbi:unnamed protein product [Sphagnum jensenii]|uniref:DUF2062 domain-containing protein n=1 Tax=Sphagnum jensenii TaxID=128206 RepID=A0ABP0XKB9_9BRYO
MSVGSSGGGGWRQYRVVRWGRNKVYEPLLIILRRGTEPKQLALSGALGLTLGVFPICGVTVFLCAAAVAILGGKCNAATVMLANFVATPIELGLILPFLRLGEWIFGSQPFELSKDALWQAISGQASKKVLLAILHALVGWAVVAPFMLMALYSLFLPLIWWSRRHFSAQDRPLNQRLVLVNEEVLLPTKDFGE